MQKKLKEVEEAVEAGEGQIEQILPITKPSNFFVSVSVKFEKGSIFFDASASNVSWHKLPYSTLLNKQNSQHVVKGLPYITRLLN